MELKFISSLRKNRKLSWLDVVYEWEDEISRQLKLMPFHPKYLAHHYSQYTYPIQHRNTRAMIEMLKRYLEPFHIKLVGRFAEWEYYNMDAAMASAIKCFAH